MYLKNNPVTNIRDTKKFSDQDSNPVSPAS